MTCPPRGSYIFEFDGWKVQLDPCTCGMYGNYSLPLVLIMFHGCFHSKRQGPKVFVIRGLDEIESTHRRIDQGKRRQSDERESLAGMPSILLRCKYICAPCAGKNDRFHF